MIVIKLKRITVNWHKPNGEPLYFDIYTDSTLEFLQEYFIDWMLKTKIFSPESLCRYIRKKVRKIKILSERQYLNLIASEFVFKTKYKKYF